ncbi:MAG: hypothetical protein GC205_12270 [Bacteroidetes bacterium]|nr:hypothetical protein [Bacteroidota bacterium]
MPDADRIPAKLLNTLRLRPTVFVGAGLILWAAAGCLSLMIARASGASGEVLWSLVATFLLTFSSATAIAGIFSGNWLQYSLRCLLGYLLLAVILALATSFLQQGIMAELARFPEMYAAFFLSFFMISGVAGAVRAIASFLGL